MADGEAEVPKPENNGQPEDRANGSENPPVNNQNQQGINEGRQVAAEAQAAADRGGASEGLQQIIQQAQAAQEAARARREEFKGMSPDQLNDELANLKDGIDGYQLIFQSTRGLSAEDKAFLFGQMSAWRAEQGEIRKALAEKQRFTSDQKNLDELRSRVRSSVDAAAGMTGMATDQLKEQAAKYKSSSEILQAGLNAERQKASPNQELINAYELELNDAKAKAAEAQRLFEEKDKESKAKEAEEETKRLDEELDKARREAGTPNELKRDIQDWKDDLKQLWDEIETAQEDFETAPEGVDKEKARKKLLELQKEELETRKKLEADEKALKAAEERARNEKGLGQARSEETVRVLTQAEFDQLDDEGKVKYLIEVSDAVNRPADMDLTTIKQKLKDGQNLSFKEAGQVIRNVSDSLFEKGRTKESLQLLDQALMSQPEIARAILDRVSQKDEVKKAMDEMYPGMGKKMWDFARKHPGWLSIILAIIAAGATAATVGVAPIVGAGVGAAGVAGGGFGINKKSRW